MDLRFFVPLIVAVSVMLNRLRSTAAQAPLLRREPMIVSGGSHTLALRMDGTVWAWGQNTYGQLGLGPSATTADKPTPQLIKFFKDPSDPGLATRKSSRLQQEPLTAWP
jgi:alpha-tubulin suppressor-like RCC1 family protein